MHHLLKTTDYFLYNVIFLLEKLTEHWNSDTKTHDCDSWNTCFRGSSELNFLKQLGNGHVCLLHSNQRWRAEDQLPPHARLLLRRPCRQSPDADDAERSGLMAGSARVCVGSPCQLHAAGVWPRRKEAARGQTLCQLIVQRVGRAGGRVACLGAKGSPRPTLFWHFGRGKRRNKMIQFKLV